MTLKKYIHTSGAWLSAIAVAASLAACGGSGGSGGGSSNANAPDPLQPYREQALQWTACDTTILGWPEDSTHPLWQELGDRLQCSTMRAPMDWSKPERSDVFVSVMRLTSADAAQRRGALLFNPGGPGGDGLAQALDLFRAFGKSNPESTQGALQLRLLDSYDMVGFSPRGTGASTRLNCATNELPRRPVPSAVGVSDERLANAAYNDRKVAQACARNPLTPFINTDATARDMDLLRVLLGEDKLNYFGYSYGTWLGGWYANLFPDKVGRMVLDSAMDYPSAYEQASALSQPLSFHRVYDKVLLPYGARHSGYFQLPASTEEIAAMVQSLTPKMQSALGESLAQLSYSRRQADDYLTLLGSALWVQTLVERPEAADKYAMQTVLRSHVFAAGDSERDQAVRAQAEELYNQYHSAYLAEPKSIELDSLYSTYWAVRCNDDVATTDSAVWSAKVRNMALQAPLFFQSDNVCAFWGGPSVTKPAVTAMQGLEVLMVQSQYDGATPTEGANNFFAQLPNARRVYVPGEYQHGVFPYTDTCVDATVVRYLLGETPLEREASCQAKPLQRDVPAEPVTPTEPPIAPATESQAQPKAAARVAKASGQGAAPDAISEATPPTYLDPEAAEKLIDRFKEGIGRRR